MLWYRTCECDTKMQGLIIIFMSNSPNAFLELEVNVFTITEVLVVWQGFSTVHERIYIFDLFTSLTLNRAKLKAVVVLLFCFDLFFGSSSFFGPGSSSLQVATTPTTLEVNMCRRVENNFLDSCWSHYLFQELGIDRCYLEICCPKTWHLSPVMQYSNTTIVRYAK